MSALGDKVSANILAQSADVPSIPWSGGGIKASLNEEGVIPQDIFNSVRLLMSDLLLLLKHFTNINLSLMYVYTLGLCVQRGAGGDHSREDRVPGHD